VNRGQFEHAVRAAAAVLGVGEVLVIGSQAVHASIDEPVPPAAQRSVEVDVVPLGDPDGRLADLVDGSIGEASLFHETFGFYAQGVSATTAVLPDGWRDRLVRFESPGTNGVVAWCLELHDLWVSKAVAGRPKDAELCEALLGAGHVSAATLRRRLAQVTGLDSAARDRAVAWIDRTT
jgi:hypothetical protein